MSLIELAIPSRFVALSARLMPWLIALTTLDFVVGGTQAYLAPDDYQQGATVKIMFVHVPSAWLGAFAWVVMSAAALGTLFWRHPMADVAAKAAAPIGATFTLICLLTGSLWGRPMWGTYWVWDARLTSVLVLGLSRLGVPVHAQAGCRRCVPHPFRAHRACLADHEPSPVTRAHPRWQGGARPEQFRICWPSHSAQRMGFLVRALP